MYFYGFLFIPLCSFLELTFWYMLEFLDLFSTYQKCPLYTVNFFAFFFFYLARKADRMYEALDAILSHEEEGHILQMAI